MKKMIVTAALLVMVAAASFAYASVIQDKLPKCSGKMCKEVGCSPDVLCVSGAHVKSCAEVCGGQ